MSFKRIYTTENSETELYVDVLVKCGTCSNRDEFVKPNTIEHVSGSFTNSEEKADIGSCDVCGENNWVGYAEKASVGFPKFTVDNGLKLFDIDQVQESLTEVQEYITVAKENGFRVHSISSRETVIILWKD
jgi:hypothetical protein